MYLLTVLFMKECFNTKLSPKLFDIKIISWTNFFLVIIGSANDYIYKRTMHTNSS